jgi:uncharacterized protein YciI
MPEYLYLIHPYRHGFFETPTPQEEAVMEAHYRYLEAGIADGNVLLAGPCLDDTFGLVILRAANETAANDLMFNDPSVKQNVMAAELHPLRISLVSRGILEKP